MADLASRTADMPMAGRTHGQHAVPATFGYKVAVWIDELLRHVERLQQAAPRLFVAMLGGGAGTFASLGKNGPPVQAGIGRQLGFGTMAVPSRALAGVSCRRHRLTENPGSTAPRLCVSAVSLPFSRWAWGPSLDLDTGAEGTKTVS